MSNVNEILASVSGNATLNDGKVTVSDAIELFNIAKVALIAASSVEVIRDTEDAAIDLVEAFAMKKSGLRKKVVLMLAKALRTAINCPDDDDNTVQK